MVGAATVSGTDAGPAATAARRSSRSCRFRLSSAMALSSVPMRASWASASRSSRASAASVAVPPARARISADQREGDRGEDQARADHHRRHHAVALHRPHLADRDHHRRDVVRRPGGEGRLDEGAAGPAGILRRGEERGDLRVGHAAGQAVGAEEEEVAFLELDVGEGGRDLVAGADRAGDHVALRVPFRFGLADLAQVEELLHQRMVAGQPLERAAAQPVGAAVACPCERGVPGLDQQRDRRSRRSRRGRPRGRGGCTSAWAAAKASARRPRPPAPCGIRAKASMTRSAARSPWPCPPMPSATAQSAPVGSIRMASSLTGAHQPAVAEPGAGRQRGRAGGGRFVAGLLIGATRPLPALPSWPRRPRGSRTARGAAASGTFACLLHGIVQWTRAKHLLPGARKLDRKFFSAAVALATGAFVSAGAEAQGLTDTEIAARFAAQREAIRAVAANPALGPSRGLVLTNIEPSGGRARRDGGGAGAARFGDAGAPLVLQPAAGGVAESRPAGSAARGRSAAPDDAGDGALDPAEGRAGQRAGHFRLRFRGAGRQPEADAADMSAARSRRPG